MNAMRFAIMEARDALQMARNQSYCEMLLTGEEIRRCEYAIQSIDRALAAEADDESAAQRARDKCIGAHDYDIDRIK